MIVGLVFASGDDRAWHPLPQLLSDPAATVGSPSQRPHLPSPGIRQLRESPTPTNPGYGVLRNGKEPCRAVGKPDDWEATY